MEGGEGAVSGSGEGSASSSLTTTSNLPSYGQVYSGFRASRLLYKKKEPPSLGATRVSVKGTDYSNPFLHAPIGANRIFTSVPDMSPVPDYDPMEAFAPISRRSLDPPPRHPPAPSAPPGPGRMRNKGLAAYRKANS